MRFWLLFLSLFLVSCGSDRFGDRTPTFKAPDVQGRKGSVPSHKKCANKRECADACHEIYRHSAAVDECMDSSVRDVEGIYKVSVFLERPFHRDLRTIREKEMALFLNISPDVFNDYIERYTISESKRVLAWLAENKGISYTLFRLGDKKYRPIFLNLMIAADPLMAEEALHRSLFKGYNFYQICNSKNNDYAIYMVHQVIVEDLCDTRLDYLLLDLHELREACILRVYCHQQGGRYVHSEDFKYISQTIEYDPVFDYIQEEDRDVGLNIHSNEINTDVCDSVCGLVPNSCR